MFTMTRWTILMLVGISWMSVGCSRHEDLTQAGTAAATEERERYEGSAERRLAEIGARIDSLKFEMDSAGPAARRELEEELDKLEAKQLAASHKLGELRAAALNQWSDVKREIADMLDDLDKRFDEARNKLRDHRG